MKIKLLILNTFTRDVKNGYAKLKMEQIYFDNNQYNYGSLLRNVIPDAKDETLQNISMVTQGQYLRNGFFL